MNTGGHPIAEPEKPKNITGKTLHTFEQFIYSGRWVIAPMYIGLWISLLIYVFKFGQQLVHLCAQIFTISESELMVEVLSLVDITMIGNLIIMITIGSYSIFVRKMILNPADRPQWLEKITSGTLKIKMGGSLMGVSGVHLLKDFVDIHVTDWDILFKHGGIHLIFVVSTLAMAKIERLSHSEPDSHEKH